ncbi:MAG: hypothetical protein KGK08_03555 [Acidobacteriota bacterium]|nr:hypothetical protein [Acidobacteriota bacterium]
MQLRQRSAVVAAILVMMALSAGAQKQPEAMSGYDRSARATILHEATVYVAADAESQHISLVTPGHEVVVLQHSGPWVKVFANTDVADQQDPDSEPEFSDADNVTPASGWIRDKGVVSPQTPGGDQILFGAAANFEAQAEQPHAPKGAAVTAHLLYRRVAEYFPQSPLAGEAAWRSADVRWQLDRQDVMTLPSAKEQDASLRQQIYEGDMRKIIRQFPGTSYAALAAYDLLDNKLCGDWQGLPHCPELETTLYEKYAQQYPDGPRAAQALYNAAYRQAVLVTMYTVDDNRKKADAAAAHVQQLVQQMQARYPKSEFTARAASIGFQVQQQIPVYGSDRD